MKIQFDLDEFKKWLKERVNNQKIYNKDFHVDENGNICETHWDNGENIGTYIILKGCTVPESITDFFEHVGLKIELELIPSKNTIVISQKSQTLKGEGKTWCFELNEESRKYQKKMK